MVDKRCSLLDRHIFELRCHFRYEYLPVCHIVVDMKYDLTKRGLRQRQKASSLDANDKEILTYSCCGILSPRLELGRSDADLQPNTFRLDDRNSSYPSAGGSSKPVRLKRLHGPRKIDSLAWNSDAASFMTLSDFQRCNAGHQTDVAPGQLRRQSRASIQLYFTVSGSVHKMCPKGGHVSCKRIVTTDS